MLAKIGFESCWLVLEKFWGYMVTVIGYEIQQSVVLFGHVNF